MKQDEEDRISRLSKKEKRKAIINNTELVKGFVLIHPYFYATSHNINLSKKSVQYTEIIIESAEKVINDLNIEFYDFSLINIEDQTTNMYNQRGLLYSYLNQFYNSDGHATISVDYYEMKKIQDAYNSPNILIINGSYKKSRAHQQTKLNSFLINIDKGMMSNLKNLTIRKPRKFLLEGYFYSIFSNFIDK